MFPSYSSFIIISHYTTKHSIKKTKLWNKSESITGFNWKKTRVFKLPTKSDQINSSNGIIQIGGVVKQALWE